MERTHEVLIAGNARLSVRHRQKKRVLKHAHFEMLSFLYLNLGVLLFKIAVSLLLLRLYFLFANINEYLLPKIPHVVVLPSPIRMSANCWLETTRMFPYIY